MEKVKQDDPFAWGRDGKLSDDPGKPVTEKMQTFCRHYVLSNLEQAAEQAGYDPRYAREYLLNNCRIQAEIDRLICLIAQYRDAEEQEFIESYKDLARSKKTPPSVREKALKTVIDWQRASRPAEAESKQHQTARLQPSVIKRLGNDRP